MATKKRTTARVRTQSKVGLETAAHRYTYDKISRLHEFLCLELDLGDIGAGYLMDRIWPVIMQYAGERRFVEGCTKSQIARYLGHMSAGDGMSWAKACGIPVEKWPEGLADFCNAIEAMVFGKLSHAELIEASNKQQVAAARYRQSLGWTN